MKNLELNKLGVSELTDNELLEANGGWWQAALAIASAAIYLYNEGHDFIEGVKEGFNAQQQQSAH